ncbi:MAG: hypothetical protein ACJ74W_13320 [Pyrinomonadaceae bacterium]
MNEDRDEIKRKDQLFTRLFTYGPMCVFALVIVLGLWDGRDDAVVYAVVGFFIWLPCWRSKS